MWFFAIAFLIILTLYFVITWNRPVKLRSKIDSSLLELDDTLKEWWNSIPSFINCIKRHADEEKEDLEMIIKTRNCIYKKLNNKEKDEVMTKLLELIHKVEDSLESKRGKFDMSEFDQSCKTLKELEEKLYQKSNMTNKNVENYNRMIRKFPYNVLSKMMGYKDEEFILQSFMSKR